MRSAQHQKRHIQAVRLRLAVLAITAICLLGAGFALGRVTAPKTAAKAPAQVHRGRSAAKRAAAKTVSAVPRAINPNIEQTLKTNLQAQNFSGTAIVIKHDKLVASVSLGQASVKRHLANREDTMFEIDSLQKSLTAGLVMRLIDAGKLKLTTPIGDYYPRFKRVPQLTVGALLQMHSGLKQAPMATPHYQSDAQLVDYVARHLTFVPKQFGTWAYTPANYVLMAGIVEQITGQSYEALFKQTYIDRLHLKQTVMAYQLDPTSNYASGYLLQGANPYATQQLTSLDQMHAELGTGQVYMSALDFYRATRSLVTGSLLKGSRAQIYRPGTPALMYDGGFYQNVPGFLRANGSGYGYMTTLQLSVDGKDAVVILGNVQGRNRNAINDLAGQLRQQFLTTK
ncbi:serine hydrolase domain-containing protein [Lacticaseibacillus hegangensis]|uniref:Serine hydrolase domain-containing protein n=1 Tax=Lacticaseibacillus hegangensis TaxID=2486010 RepID=A0ABW4CW21_9LACO|nr:serine hydrolase domain-containing protein [Lacticaseibacillus hegangensis]